MRRGPPLRDDQEVSSSATNSSKTIETPQGSARFYDISTVEGVDVKSLPYSVRVLLENSLRNSEAVRGAKDAVSAMKTWPGRAEAEVPFMPSRVLLQDYTGVPLIVDLAGLREAVKKRGLDPTLVNSKVPVDLIVDHSLQVDRWAQDDSIFVNLEKEYERNSERYALLKWAQSSFSNMRIFPPGKGICHQVNLEYIATVVDVRRLGGELTAFPDSVVGTDSHTTMVNGLGVLGWGVGGIEAEAVMLGEPCHMPLPRVTGVKLIGRLREGCTPTDVVLTVTEVLRRKGVVGQFVEYFGEGFSRLSVPDRATMGNMSPEYGATVGFFPVDEVTLQYMLGTGRPRAHVDFVRKYCELNHLFYRPDLPEPNYDDVVVVDLSTVEPSVAGPRNPDERISLRMVPSAIPGIVATGRGAHPAGTAGVRRTAIQGPGSQVVVQEMSKAAGGLKDGDVVIAAITSCTNTSNPTVMIGAALLAQRLMKLGIRPAPYVKTSMAPGSRVVTDYLTGSGLLPYLEGMGFGVVGYGCTTCIGNSGPLDPAVEKQIVDGDLYVAAVLSGNRNFDGRIHPLVRGAFLTSPMLVVAYSVAGRMDFDFDAEPLGKAEDGRGVYLKDVWPTIDDIGSAVRSALRPELYTKRYADATKGDEKWDSLGSLQGETFAWDPASTYIKQPPWFDDTSKPGDIQGARILALLGDRVTTDHISPAGAIPPSSPAGVYLKERGVQPPMFSSYGSRRGNHELMERGGFSNIRLTNALADGKVGGWTKHWPSGEVMTIYDASVRYAGGSVPLVVMAGKEYGAGSSRDWAAKAPRLLGVRAVIAESFERIHRSNLVSMGILPLEFPPGTGWKDMGLKGDELVTIAGIETMTSPGGSVEVSINRPDGGRNFSAKVRIDNAAELGYFKKGGVLPYVFEDIVSGRIG